MVKQKQILPSEIARELGKRGGRKVADRYGREYFSRIGKLGAKSRWSKASEKEEK